MVAKRTTAELKAHHGLQAIQATMASARPRRDLVAEVGDVTRFACAQWLRSRVGMTRKHYAYLLMQIESSDGFTWRKDDRLLQLCGPPLALNGDSYRPGNRDLGRVRWPPPTSHEPEDGLFSGATAWSGFACR